MFWRKRKRKKGNICRQYFLKSMKESFIKENQKKFAFNEFHILFGQEKKEKRGKVIGKLALFTK